MGTVSLIEGSNVGREVAVKDRSKLQVVRMLAVQLQKLRRRVWGHRQRARLLGWRGYLALELAPLRYALDRRSLRCVRLSGFQYPVYFRAGTSDVDVIRQVFGDRSYDGIAKEPGVEFIVDLGANIGCATFYLLQHYPAARAIVVEPDSGNMEVCRRNLAPFGDRVQFIQAGVWSASLPMVVVRGQYRDGGAWSFQVRPARSCERPDFLARTVDSVLAESGFPRVDLLKMDIEAAEEEVFRYGSADWLPSVRTLAIELHGADCEAALMTAIKDVAHTTDTVGEELTVVRFKGPGVSAER